MNTGSERNRTLESKSKYVSDLKNEKLVMRKILVFVICMSIVTVIFPQEANRPIPDIKQLESISFRFGMLWGGHFVPNGRAKLDIGSGDCWADVPAGSFSFEEIYKLLAPHLKQDSDSEDVIDVMRVWLSIPDNLDSSHAFFLDDKDVMRKIMHGLCDKVVPWDKTLFENALRKYPIVPGDPPYLKEEDQIKSEVRGQKSEVRGQKSEGEEEVIGDEPKEEIKEEVIGDQLEVKEEVAGDQLEVTGAGTGEEMPSPVAARKTNRPSLLFYVGAGILVCVGAALFFTRKR